MEKPKYLRGHFSNAVGTLKNIEADLEKPQTPKDAHTLLEEKRYFSDYRDQAVSASRTLEEAEAAAQKDFAKTNVLLTRLENLEHEPEIGAKEKDRGDYTLQDAFHEEFHTAMPSFHLTQEDAQEISLESPKGRLGRFFDWLRGR